MEYVEIKSRNLLDKKDKLVVLLANMEKNYPGLYQGLQSRYPYLECIINGRVLKSDIDTLLENAKDRAKRQDKTISQVLDYRKPEQMIFNYYLGTCVEEIVRGLILASDSICERHGSDKEFFNSTFISCKADLIIDDDLLVDVKSSAFLKERDFNMKEYQIDKYMKQNLDIILADYESHPGCLYFSWFNIVNIKDNIQEGSFIQKYGDNEKVWKKVTLDGKDLHMINFKKPSQDKIIDTVFKITSKNGLHYIGKDSVSKTFSNHKIKL